MAEDPSTILADAHRMADESMAADAVKRDAAPLTVDLFDPANPAEPKRELVANFDPHRHVRWEARPAVAELDLAALEFRGKALLTEPTIAALHAAGLVNLKAILGGGLDALRNAGVRGKVAEDLLAWAGSRHASVYAFHELAAERGEVVEQPVTNADATPEKDQNAGGAVSE